jgi:hypothetical protein
MKKLFTLVALMMCFLGAKAETKVDFEVDYSAAGATWQHGWLNEEEHIKFEDGAIHFHSDEAKPAFYDFQYQLHPGIPSLDNDAQYTITLRIKGTVAQDIHASFSGSNTPGMIPVPTEWQDVVLEGCVNDPNAQYFANSGCLLIQPGDYVGDIWISYIKITHEEKAPTRPVEWIEQLTNGDAEAAWPEWSLAKNDEGVNINWRGNRTGEICAWSIVRGKNIDPSQEPDPVNDPDGNPIAEGKPRPFPCDIEDDGTGNHVFVVHSTAADNQYTDWQAWDNQFFIQSPKAWKSGTKVKIHFRYKAEKAATAQTQIHRQNPSHYLFYQGIGDVNFTTEWQEFDNTITFSDSQAGGWSVAFNLNVDNKEPNTFYFDDLSWQVMKLDEGLFVASSNTTTGIEYDYDNAIQFEGPTDDGVYWATVGTEGKQDTWVNQVMISTVRGETAAFKGATIKPSGTIKGNDEDNWQDYTPASQNKIDLPAAGVWQIFIAPEDNQILFMMTEGEELVVKEPVDIIANSEELVVNGVERDWLASDDGNPKAGEDEVGTGQTWDNQFFIVANRVLKGDEETVIEFDYVATLDAKTLTGTAAMPGAYRKNAFGDVDFTTTEQHFKADFKIPASDWGGNAITDAQTISFDMAVIKAANDYTIKNVKWYLKGDENENGKTLENLIDATGTKNFWVKISAGTDPYPYGTDPSGINNVVAKSNASTATYNLAGQRISKEYKGIVVKDGKKVVVK